MNPKEIEHKLKTAIDHSVPDVLDHILKECEHGKPVPLPVVNGSPNHSRRRPFIAFTSAAAVFLVILAVVTFGLPGDNAYHTVASIVSLDVNPSIEIKTNREDKVLEVNALNDEAITILDGMDLKDVDINVAVNALIGSLVKNGYIDEYKNSILVSVENTNKANGSRLQEKITQDISQFLGTESIQGAIISQSVSEDADLRKMAEEHHISYGKAILIQEILKKTPLLTFADLTPLSINELNLLAESKEAQLTNMTSIGSASDKAYIGEERAKETALAYGKIAPETATSISMELDVEDGKMVYEVDFFAGGIEYEYEIDAVSGTVLISEQENHSDVPQGEREEQGDDGYDDDDGGNDGRDDNDSDDDGSDDDDDRDDDGSDDDNDDDLEHDDADFDD